MLIIWMTFGTIVALTQAFWLRRRLKKATDDPASKRVLDMVIYALSFVLGCATAYFMGGAI